jgi:hypothetical protein
LSQIKGVIPSENKESPWRAIGFFGGIVLVWLITLIGAALLLVFA